MSTTRTWTDEELMALPRDGFKRDLVVEVLSPGDSKREILEKIGEYLEAGVRQAWVVDPEARRAAVHRTATAVTSMDETGELDGEDVVPGFRCHLRDILA